MIEREALQRRLLERALAWSDTLPPTLRAPLHEMWIRRRYLLVDELPDYFGPRATPLLGLPLWIADHLRASGYQISDDVVEDTCEAALTGYFLIRIQDDHCDEGTGDAVTVLLLAAALQARMTELFARVAPRGSWFWPLLTKAFVTEADAMIREHGLLKGAGVPDRATFDRLLGRYEPLLLAAAAPLALADAGDLLPDLRAAVRHIGASVQLFNDAMDAADDLRNGNRTWAVTRLAPGGSSEELWANLLGGGFDALIDESIAEAKLAASRLRATHLEQAAALLDARAAELDAVRSHWFEEVFGGLFPYDEGTSLADDTRE